MSTFKYHRNNKNRYNIYESPIERIEVKNFYVILRNTLFFIALTLSLFITGLISFDIYKDKKTQLLIINQVQQNLTKDEVTKIKLIQAISNNILQKIDTNSTLKDINQLQLKRIIKNVVEKIENSPNQIIYTQK